MQLSFTTFVPKYLNLATFVKDILHILISSVYPASSSWDMQVYLVFPTIYPTPRSFMQLTHSIWKIYNSLLIAFYRTLFSVTVTVLSSLKCRSWWRHASENTLYERPKVPQYFEGQSVQIRTSTNILVLKTWVFFKKLICYFCLCFLEYVVYAYWYVNKLHIVIPAKPSLCSLNIEP